MVQIKFAIQKAIRFSIMVRSQTNPKGIDWMAYPIP